MARTQQGRPQGRQQARRIVEPRPEKPTGARDAGAFEYQLPLPLNNPTCPLLPHIYHAPTRMAAEFFGSSPLKVARDDALPLAATRISIESQFSQLNPGSESTAARRVHPLGGVPTGPSSAQERERDGRTDRREGPASFNCRCRDRTRQRIEAVNFFFI